MLGPRKGGEEQPWSGVQGRRESPQPGSPQQLSNVPVPGPGRAGMASVPLGAVTLALRA